MLQILFATLAGAIVGTPRGEALRWTRGRRWCGRLVVTSPYTLCNGQRPPVDVEPVTVQM